MGDKPLAVEDAAPGLRVPVRVAGKVMNIACGDGSQSMRWLASVVAQ